MILAGGWGRAGMPSRVAGVLDGLVDLALWVAGVGRVGLSCVDGQVGEGSVDEFGEDLFDDGVAAVLGFGLHEDVLRAVGERGVVTPYGEQ
jgi:hypothetical protein